MTRKTKCRAAASATVLAIMCLLSASPARAARGDCGQPVSAGAQPIASDCLFVLRAAVGSETCDPACVCDTNGSDDTTASDALVCLKKAVGQDVALECRCPVSPDGAQLQLNLFTAGNQSRPRIAADGDGNFVVAWESAGPAGTDSDGTSIRAQRFLNTGEASGTEFQVNAFTTGDQSYAAVAAHSDGSFVVAWDGASEDEDGKGVNMRAFDATGTATGTELRVNTYTTADQQSPSVALDPQSGGFVVVWQSYGSSGTDTSKFSIHGQSFDAAGGVAGTEFQANTLTPDSQIEPVVAFTAGGAFIVAWTSLAGSGTDPDVNVRAQLFGADGQPNSTEFRLNSYTTGTQSRPTVASDGAGGFIVAWSSEGSNTDADTAIVARHLGSGGQLGSEFFVNSYTTRAQTDPRVTPLDESRFVIVWQSDSSEGGDADYVIEGQVFDKDAFPIGTEFQVNTYTTGNQVSADVAAKSDAAFMVVWQSEGSPDSDSDGYSIQGQRFH